MLTAATITAATWQDAVRTPSQCPTPTPRSDSMKQEMKEMLASPYSDDSTFRVNLGLSGVDSSRVIAVTDSLVCTRVTAVIDSAARSTPSNGSYFVLKLGRLYFAFAH